MADKTGIEWTDATWNPVVGCTPVSSGCDNCYAAREASGRLAHLDLYAGLAKDGEFTGEVRLVPERLDQPRHWTRPRRIFVNSMSDLFHPKVPIDFIREVFDVMASCPQHTFQVLTKRPHRMARFTWAYYRDATGPAPNIWLGTSIENADNLWRCRPLASTFAAVHFLSLEPLLGPLEDLKLDGIDWVIVGGESGPNARPMCPVWATDIRDRCQEQHIPFLFKQWGEWGFKAGRDHYWSHRVYADGRVLPRRSAEELGALFDRDFGGFVVDLLEEWYGMGKIGKKSAGRELDGRTWDEYPR